MNRQYSFIPTIISILLCTVIGFRVGIMEDSSGEDTLSILVWAFGIAAFIAGILTYFDLDNAKVKDKPPLLEPAILFWSGATMLSGYLIASWP